MMSKLAKVEKYVNKGKEGELIKLLGEKEKEVRLAVIEGMGKIGRDDSFNRLIDLIKDPDADIRVAAANALGALRNGHASEHLRHCIEKESDEKVIAAMKEALASLRRED